MPAAAPAEVRTRPLSTNRTFGFTSTSGKRRANSSHIAQWVVALCPSSIPEAARTNADVHRLTTRAVGAMPASAAASSSPSPPGPGRSASRSWVAMTTVSAVRSTDSSLRMSMVKSWLVRTGRPPNEQVTTS